MPLHKRSITLAVSLLLCAAVVRARGCVIAGACAQSKTEHLVTCRQCKLCAMSCWQLTRKRLLDAISTITLTANCCEIRLGTLVLQALIRPCFIL